MNNQEFIQSASKEELVDLFLKIMVRCWNRPTKIDMSKLDDYKKPIRDWLDEERRNNEIKTLTWDQDARNKIKSTAWSVKVEERK